MGDAGFDRINHLSLQGVAVEIFTAPYLLPISAPPVHGGAIAVADGRIVDAGPLKLLRRWQGATVREFPGCAIMPGLVNAHTHLELTHFSSWKLRKGIDYSPRTYVDWIIQVIKIRRGLSGEELEHSVREGLRIALESGNTSIGDILTDPALLPLYFASPLGGRLFLEVIGHDPARFVPLLERVTEALDAFGGQFLQPGLSPHAPHTLSPRLHRDVAALARTREIPMATHLAESREEGSFFHDTTGKIAELLYPFAGWEGYLPAPQRTTSTAFLDQAGVLGPGTAAVHCVHVTPADVEILKERGVTVILCPRSNDRLYVGKAPVQLLRKAGIPLALGTDSLASNDSLSLWDEMRFVRREFSGEFAPDELLAMATTGGAGALRIAPEAGSLEEGKRADFLIMRLPEGTHGPHPEEALIEEGVLEEVYIRGRKVV
jgi:aminodeoxyfutalosine deaminase